MSPRASKTAAIDLEAVGQIGFFHATAGDAARELARNYVSPTDPKTHGIKAFAKLVFPHKSDEQAYTAFMNCSSATAPEKFSDDEWRAIIRFGHEQNKHFVAEFFCGPEYKLTPVRLEEVSKRAKKQRIAYHLAQVAILAQGEDE